MIIMKIFIPYKEMRRNKDGELKKTGLILVMTLFYYILDYENATKKQNSFVSSKKKV